jgi:hypothetical protein
MGSTSRASSQPFFHRCVAAALTLLLVAITGGCAASDDDDESSAATVASAAPAEAAPPVAASGGSGDVATVADGDADAALGTSSAGPRLLIVDVTIGVEVTSVDESVTRVVDIGAAHGAQVYASDIDLRSDDLARARVVLKVPPDEVEAVVAEIATVGRLVSRVQSTDDVTDQVTDLETRIATAQESVARLQALMAGAVNLGDIVLLEGELTKRQTELEQLLAAERNLEGQTTRATLTVDLAVSPIASAAAVEADVDDHMSIADAFRTGIRWFVTAITAALIFLGLSAPFLVLVVGGGVLAWWVRRRTRRRHRWEPRSRSAAPPPPPAPAADQRTSEPDSSDAART